MNKTLTLLLMAALISCKNKEWKQLSKDRDAFLDSSDYYKRKIDEYPSDLSKHFLYYDSAVYYHNKAVKAHNRQVEIYLNE